MNVYLLVLILLSAADVAVSYRNLSSGGRELNLLPKALIAKLGFWPVALGTKALIIGVPVIGGQFYPGVEGYYIVASILTAVAVGYSLVKGRK
jgi:hypothetical protein